MTFIHTCALKSGMVLAADIRGDKGELLLSGGQVLTFKHISRLISGAVDGAYVTDGNEDASQTRGIISRTLRDNTMVAVKTLFDIAGAGSKNGIDQAYFSLESCLDEIIDEILQNKDVVSNIVDIKTYDDYTYQHSVNVAALAVVVGASLNMSRRGLYRLGMGALLHDIGKIYIPKEILNKQGKLTYEQYELMKEHPKLGYDYLKGRWKVPTESIIAVLTHHERCDGTGYPYGITAEKQTLEGKLVAICDVYDALISERPYRPALPPSEAMEHIIGNSGTMFDEKLIKEFICKIAPYPVNTKVVLSNGLKARVIENYSNGLARPRLIVENTVFGDEGEILDLFNDPELFNVTIVKVDR
ncbi:MAG: HD-GYP domain-containing protein [Clostridiaceae bacterium]|nr:HD-GYP domain-containing protein [Clostridiaceae bacterium]